MHDKMFLVVLFVVAFVGSMAQAEVEGFVETFSGNGPYPSSSIGSVRAGFDNPDWILGLVDVGEFVDEGFHISVSTDPSDPESLAYSIVIREVFGSGSFMQRIEVHAPSIQQLDGGGFILLSASPVPYPGRAITPFVLASFNTDRFTIIDQFQNLTAFEGPAGEDLALEIHYDQFRREVFYGIDRNLDDEVPPVMVGPVDWQQEFAATRYVDIRLEAAGDRVTVSGTLDHWSLVPLDDGSIGDFNQDDTLDLSDIDLLSSAVRSGEFDVRYDLNRDQVLSQGDREVWVQELVRTYFGDSNLDGEFNSADLVAVFEEGEYEDDIASNSTWHTGDWSGDGEFSSFDLVVAFQDTGYEQGPRSAAPRLIPITRPQAVPEPSCRLLLLIGGAMLLRRRTGAGNRGRVAG